MSADVFTQHDALDALRNKNVFFMGDSIMRHIYKDLVYLLSPRTMGDFVPHNRLTAKGESSFYGDRLVYRTEITRGRDYREVRDFDLTRVRLTYYFLTRCFSEELEDFLDQYAARFGGHPDIVVINSGLWDVNRWGPRGIDRFKENIISLMRYFEANFPTRTQIIWLTTPPISVDIRGGFLIQQLEFQRHSMRFCIAESNQYCASVVASFGYDVLDLHYYFNEQLFRRAWDGIHWNPDGVRMQTNLLLTHICLSRDLALPNVVPVECLHEAELAADAACFDYTDKKKTREKDSSPPAAATPRNDRRRLPSSSAPFALEIGDVQRP